MREDATNRRVRVPTGAATAVTVDLMISLSLMGIGNVHGVAKLLVRMVLLIALRIPGSVSTDGSAIRMAIHPC